MTYYNAAETRKINAAAANVDTLASTFGNGSHKMKRLRQLATSEARALDDAFEQHGRQPGVRSVSKIVQFFTEGFERGAELDTDEAIEMLFQMPGWSAGAMMEGATCRKRLERLHGEGRPGFDEHDVAAIVRTMIAHSNDCEFADTMASKRFDAETRTGADVARDIVAAAGYVDPRTIAA